MKTLYNASNMKTVNSHDTPWKTFIHLLQSMVDPYYYLFGYKLWHDPGSPFCPADEGKVGENNDEPIPVDKTGEIFRQMYPMPPLTI